MMLSPWQQSREKEGERKETEGKESKKTNPVPNSVPELGRPMKREGRGRRREDQRREDKRRNADVCFHAAWPSNLLFSLHVATGLSLKLWCPGTRGATSVPLILFDLPIQTTVMTRDSSGGSAEALLPQPDLYILIIFTLLSISQLNQTRRTRLFLGLDCLLALYSMWTLPRVCVCVGDFSILFRFPCHVVHHLIVRRDRFWMRVPFFLHFNVPHRHRCLSLYMSCLFLIANFPSRTRRGTIIFVATHVCVSVWVCGRMRLCRVCTVCHSSGTWCHCCVDRYRCVTALELTDESTEPDPGIAFGCKPLTLTLLLGDVLYTLCILFFFFAPL